MVFQTPIEEPTVHKDAPLLAPKQPPPVMQPVLTCSNGARTVNGNGHSAAPPANSKDTSKGIKFLQVLRTLLLDIPLSILFFLLLVAFCLHQVHHDIFVPMLQKALRSNEDLLEEFTYYERKCTVEDVTTRNLTDLMATSPQQAVDSIMLHGGVVFNQILSKETTTELRKYVMERNANLTRVEKIPLSQGRNRVSFAFDASEHPIVSQTMKEVASHPLLKPTLEKLIMPEPGVAEMTVITAHPGAPHQTWHQDIKEDGSPLKYGRTYTHSHSLFVVLQDTTEAMGASQLCPGTHYCPNYGMADTCAKVGMPLSEVTEEGVLPAGAGALLSQQVWHRGAKHTDPDAPSRVLLIISFLGRPDLTKDRRQLSRGTYFHQRWNMWGHSLPDLLDAKRYMSAPFSILRCLGLWLPKSRKWGFDLITATALRMANRQNGVDSDTLDIFANEVVSGIFHVPEWLQGPVTEDDDCWPRYLRKTLDQCLDFMLEVHLYVIGIYLLLVFLLAGICRSTKILKGTFGRMCFTHGILLVIAMGIMHHVNQSPLAQDIKHNRWLLPAFEYHQDDSIPNKQVSMGPTTLPERTDVLVGTRFDSKYLGAFDRWLDFHPGNRNLESAMEKSASVNYSGLPSIFQEQIITNLLHTNRHGRFLQQDYRTGVWRHMLEEEARDYLRVSLEKTKSPLLKTLHKQVAYMLADYRFGLKRGTALARDSQDYLWNWQKKLFPREDESVAPTSAPTESPSLQVSSPLPTYPTAKSKSTGVKAHTAQSPSWTTIPPDSKLQAGDLAMVYYGDDEWLRASIVRVRKNGKYNMAFEDGNAETIEAEDVYPNVPLEEGGRVRRKFGQEWFQGTITKVHPSGRVSIAYDDGDFEEFASPKRYQVIPPY